MESSKEQTIAIIEAMQKQDVPTYDERIGLLTSLLNWINENRSSIIEALRNDLGKPEEEILLSEIFVSTSEIKHALKNLKRWEKKKVVRPTIMTATAKSWYYYRPKGVVLIITPWNFPFNLTLSPLVSAIAAGNCIVVKPSSLSSHSSKLISRMVSDLFPPDMVHVFSGGRESASFLCSLPFDHIFFIGSSKTAKTVMALASPQLTPLTLELGGENCEIITKSANLKDAVKKCVWGKFMNNGQCCVAPNIVFVHHSCYKNFLSLLTKELNRVYGDNYQQRKANSDYGRIICKSHFKQLESVMAEMFTFGAEIVYGGKYDEDDLFWEPTVITNIPIGKAGEIKEIFGPILPVIPYNSLEDLEVEIFQNSSPLSLYLFSKDISEISRVIDNTRSGTVCVNDVITNFLQLNLPFGGVGSSGSGRGHGFFGYRDFSFERAVLKHHTLNPLKLLFPPYNKLVKMLINVVVKYL